MFHVRHSLTYVLVGGTLGAQLGWRWNRRLSGPRLRHYFAILVLGAAAIVGWKLSVLPA